MASIFDSLARSRFARRSDRETTTAPSRRSHKSPKARLRLEALEGRELLSQGGFAGPFAPSAEIRAMDSPATVQVSEKAVSLFDGIYRGDFSGTATVSGQEFTMRGSIVAEVSNGIISVQEPAAGGGTISDTGAVQFGSLLYVPGTSDKVVVEFKGQAIIQVSGASVASGTWTAPFEGSTASGKWTATRPASAPGPAPEFFKPKDATVILTPDLEAKVNKIAAEYYRLSGGKILLLTDGIRTPARQAELLFPLLGTAKGRRSQLDLYKGSRLIKEVFAAYDSASTDDARKAAMTATIQAQLDRGAVLSKHLRNNAVDIRSKKPDGAKIKLLRRAIKVLPGTKIVNESTKEGGPHWHVQFA